MKRNKFMEFLNSKGQLAAVFTFVGVAGICAGAAAYNRGNDKSSAEQEALNSSSEPVLTNKNAEPKSTEQKTKPKTDANSASSKKETDKAAKPETKPETQNKETENTALLDGEEGDDFEIALSWPLEGDILMGYSPVSPVYDATLDQYRTNSNVCIAAEAGEAVCAAADGTVKEVFEDETVGNYVVVEHENGWKTTYSQLADIKVAAGDTVSKGEVLGNVAQPSIYSSAMGPHLEFTVMFDDMTVDPETALG